MRTAEQAIKSAAPAFLKLLAPAPAAQPKNFSSSQPQLRLQLQLRSPAQNYNELCQVSQKRTNSRTAHLRTRQLNPVKEVENSFRLREKHVSKK